VSRMLRLLLLRQGRGAEGMGGGQAAADSDGTDALLTGGLVGQLCQHGLAGGQLSAQGGHEGKHGQAAVDQLCKGSGEGETRGRARW
jgi:hypothetical protein